MRRVRRHVLAGVVALAVIVAGLAAGVLWNRPPGDLDGEWVATSVRVDEVLHHARDGAFRTLSVRTEGGHLVGHATAGCNTSSGALTYRTGGDLTLDDWVTTTMGCPEPLDEVESTFLSALAGVDHVEVDGDELVLSGDGVQLMFTRLDETGVLSGGGPDRVH